MSTWKDIAEICEHDYGTQVDYEDRFFVCPDCEEPIYADDWDAEDFFSFEGEPMCPVCGMRFILIDEE